MDRPDVLIPVYKPDKRFDRLMKMLFQQTIRPARLILLNTETDGFTCKELRERVEKAVSRYDQPLLPVIEVKLVGIKKENFDHGGTRNLGVTKYSTSDFFLFLTQDAVPADIFLVERLLRCFSNETVGAAYARQLASEEASFSEKYLRIHNYPSVSKVKSKKDLDELGIKTFLLSNACAMYRRSSYDRNGGFVTDTIFNEDMIFGATLIQNGEEIAYCAEAKVNHTHRYSLSQQFKRSFDMAVSQTDYKKLFKGVSSEQTGLSFVRGAVDLCLSQKRYGDMLSFVVESFVRYCGFFLGKHYRILPSGLVLTCSFQPEFFRNRKRKQKMDETRDTNANETERLEELHQLELTALRSFVAFCESNRLRYYAIGGTLLGAVRHEGFIPWDDDVDLAMPRKDYDRLIELVKNEDTESVLPGGFLIDCWQRNPEFKSYFAKIYSPDYEIHEKLLEKDTVRKGYLIDLLPIDGTPEDATKRESYYGKAMWYRFLCGTANVKTGIRTSRPKWEQFILRTVRALKLYRFLKIEKIYRDMDKLFKRQDAEQAEFTGTLTGAYKTREIVPRVYFGETYDEYKEMNFEGLKLRCPVQWEQYLKHMFGDYRKLPEEEERKVHYETIIRKSEEEQE